MAFSQIATSVTIINSGLIGYNGISLTDITASTVSAIASGSAIEIAGAFFKADSDVTINASSWTAITTASNVYIALTPSGTAGSQIITASYTSDAPVWSTSKQGWYASAVSNIRIIGGLYKTSATKYDFKFILYGNLYSFNENYGFVKLGGGALAKSKFSVRCTAIGVWALSENTTGMYNTAVGFGSLSVNTIGTNNTAVGYGSLNLNIDGAYNTSMGSSSLGLNTTGSYNTAVGYSSLANNTGANNTAIGNQALFYNTTGVENVAVGTGSLFTNTTGVNNTAVGAYSLNISVGSNNTALGYDAGVNVNTGSNITCIGYNANPPASTSSNIITLGNSSVTQLRCQVTTITALSDERDKINIRDLSLGIDFINKMRPVEYNWDRRDWYDNNKSDGSKASKDLDCNVGTAQNLQALMKDTNSKWLKLVLEDNPDKLEVTAGKILPIIVKAIQELSKEIDELKRAKNA